MKNEGQLLRAFTFLISLMLIISIAGCGSNSGRSIKDPRFGHEFSWDTEGLVDSIEKIELADNLELERLATKIQKIDNEEAKLVGSYFENLAKYYRFESIDWIKGFAEIYSDLRDRKLYSYVFVIDYLESRYYGRAENNILAEARLLRMTEYVYLPENRVIMQYFLNIVFSRDAFVSFESDLLKQIDEKKNIIKNLDPNSWNHFHYLQYLSLARSYARHPDSLSRAYEVFDYIIERSQEVNHVSTIGDCYFQIANFKNKEGKIEEAIGFISKAIDATNRSGIKFHAHVYEFGMGHLYMKNDNAQPAKAVEHYQNALDLYPDDDVDNICADCYAYLGWAEFKTNESVEGLKEANEHWSIVLQDKHRKKTGYLLALQRKQWALGHLGYTQKAQEVASKIQDWHPIRQRFNNLMHTSLINASAQVILKDKEIKSSLSAENEIQKQNIRNQNSILILSGLLLLFGGAAVFYYRGRSMLLKVSLEKSKVINSQNEQLVEVNQGLKISNDQLSVLLKKIELREMELEGELKSQILMSNNIKSMLRVLQGKIEKSGNSEADKNELMSIISRSTSNRLFEELDHKFLKTNEEFFAKISLIHPNLTKNDLMLAALLKMNISSKEIAEIQYKELGSVKVARSRLQKKLKLNKPEMGNLVTYLNSIL